MNKLAIIIASLGLCSPVFAQDSIIKSDKHHEIGVDASPLLQRFVAGTGSGFGLNAFYLMYRYHFDTWAIRAGIGGNISTHNDTRNDTIIDERKYNNIDFRLGVERKHDFYKRWQFFYGIDLHFSHRTDVYETHDGNIFHSANTHEVNSYGLAPTMGFRFKINKSLSVTTETSFIVSYFNSHSERIYYPDTQYNQITKGHGINSSFYPPASIFVTYRF